MQSNIWVLSKEFHNGTTPNRGLVIMKGNAGMFFKEHTTISNMASKHPDCLQEKTGSQARLL
jgi:hypothetical protein